MLKQKTVIKHCMWKKQAVENYVKTAAEQLIKINIFNDIVPKVSLFAK